LPNQEGFFLTVRGSKFIKDIEIFYENYLMLDCEREAGMTEAVVENK